jgi:hypothetical protein
MKHRTSSIVILALLSLLPTLASFAQSNAPALLILPPADWDVKHHILFGLVTTNKQGTFPLHPAWVGIEKVTVCTGMVYTVLNTDKAEQTARTARLNTFRVWDRSSIPGIPEDRVIESGTKGEIAGGLYRSSLPTDSDLLEMRDFAAVRRFVGRDINFTNHFLSEGFHYVALGPYDSIDTLYVAFGKMGVATNIDSILIRRGRLYPQK